MPSTKTKASTTAFTNEVMPSEGAMSRFDITVNEVKGPDTTKKVAVIDIEGPIGFDFMKWMEDEPQNTAADIMSKVKEIEELDVEEIKVNIIKSPGGLIEEGIAIHDALAMSKAHVTTEVIGFAASISSVILMAGNTRRISANARVLPHHAMAVPFEPINVFDLKGIKESLDAQDERIDSIYEKRGVSPERSKIMNKNGGHGAWIKASDAKEMGFVDEVFEPFTSVACAPIESNMYARMFQLPELNNTEDVYERELDSNNNEQEEVEMTEEQMLALLAKNNEALTASLTKEFNKVKDPVVPEEPKVKSVEVAFEGDETNMEDIEAHKQKVEIAQLKNATDFNDVASLILYKKELNKILNGEESNSSEAGFKKPLHQKLVKNEGLNEADQDLIDSRAAMKAINDKNKEELNGTRN